jgi:RNA-directed DNA polymerase
MRRELHVQFREGLGVQFPRATRLVIGFEHQEDAERVRGVLPLRRQRYGLTLHPDKTRLLDFRPPPVGQRGGQGPAPFDFLGFTLYWRRTRRGRWRLGCKTRRARLGRAIRTVYAWCRSHRHEDVKVQHVALCSRLRGHSNSFGVKGNLRRLACLEYHARHACSDWLRRRSQRTRLTWARFTALLRAFPLPRPRIVVRLWGLPP